MFTRRRLKGRTIAVLAADGFEKVELIIPLRALKATGATVDVVSLRRGRIRGVNLHLPASRVRVPSGTARSAPAGKSASTPAAANSPMIRSAAAREMP